MNFKNPSKMNEAQAKECIIHKLPKLYKSETGKKFIHHLVNAFGASNPLYVPYVEEGQQLTDCITNRILQPAFDHKPTAEEMGTIKLVVKYDTAVKTKNSDKILGVVEYNSLMDWIHEAIESGNEEISNIIRYNKKKLSASKKKSGKKPNRPKTKVDFRKTLSASDDVSRKLNNLKKQMK